MSGSSVRLLVNLPPTFFTQPELDAAFDRLQSSAEVRMTSHDDLAPMLPDLRWAEAVLMWAWPVFGEEVLCDLPALRFVGQINTTAKMASGCLRLGIALSEVRHAWSPAVAEMALALILAGLRRTSQYHIEMRSGAERWVNRFPADIDPRERELAGRSVGIVGFGCIGQRLAELLGPFHVTLRVYDPHLPSEVAAGFGARMSSMMELASQSDVVVLCAANTEEARHVLDAAAIGALRKDAVLVNVGRSLLVDMPALVRRLRHGDLVAMLDVFDQEPLEADSPLRRLPNAYLTPHRAGGTLASVVRALDWLTDDFEAFVQGRPLRHAVTVAMLPSFP
jgi:phosphoglycerate dehydrogenase-like enzyme